MSQQQRQPVYQHDCDECHFILTDETRSGEPRTNAVDVWLHEHKNRVVLIRRFSSEPADYSAREFYLP